jgi:hypothetical protein
MPALVSHAAEVVALSSSKDTVGLQSIMAQAGPRVGGARGWW